MAAQPATTEAPPALPELLAQLDDTLADARLSDDERRVLVHTLREAQPPEDGLRQLRNRAFDLVRARTADPEQLALLKWLEGVVRAIDTGRSPDSVAVRSQAFFSPGTACLQAINQQLRSARHSVDLCVFTLSDDRITAEILAAHRRGVSLRCISDNDKEFDLGSDIGQLRAAGIPVAVDRTEAHMHHKFAIFDGARLLNGSYNWTRSACEFNEENLVLTNDPSLVRRFADEFDSLWKELQASR
ncbi:phospholipase D-like domain-containing protein [Variovorax sp. NFACC27]|uniref:phospholipase D-like domain-containing protein n=1 Tax=unclassified Variovorax TaxID=663243 RepID=UPI00089C6B51|nr:PLD-like domain-containing protein [Variovorax sp. NFACC28]SEG91507.1 PLD-like domain-containing protein [Variovorax sp. NFACC29]SFD50109.1 PLD-like domain-containing protein [Variovorax sp. NFACC26]SFG72333.1 PLD-like domain-containing protein [Variovorax sp. NFACC27]